MNHEKPEPDEDAQSTFRHAKGLVDSLARLFPGKFGGVLPLTPDEEALILACRAKKEQGPEIARRLAECIEKAA